MVWYRPLRPRRFFSPSVRSKGKLNMLQFSKTHSAAEDYGRAARRKQTRLRNCLENLLGIVRRQYAVMLFVSALTMALAFIYVVTATPRFMAVATMFIDRGKVQPFTQQQQCWSIIRSIPGRWTVKSRSSNPIRSRFR